MSPLAGKKPLPMRPARLAAAWLWPPIVIGTLPLVGLGLELMPSNETNSPSKLALSSAQSARMTSTYSSVRAARRSHGTPSTSNSSLSQPMPMPSCRRPPDMASTVATSLA